MAQAACETSARLVEAAAPFAPTHFLLVASAANLGKSIACVAASATRAGFHRALIREHNLADLTGKAGSQAIVTTLVGTGGGLAISAACVSTQEHVLSAVLALSCAQILAVGRSMQVVARWSRGPC